AMYLALHGATPAAHDAGTGEPGSLRRALVWLTNAPKFLVKTRIGVCFGLTPETAPQLAGVLRLVGKLERSELLLWDGGAGDPDAPRVPASAALRALDVAVTTAQKLGVRIQTVGFERLRTAAAPRHAGAARGDRPTTALDADPRPRADRGGVSEGVRHDLRCDLLQSGALPPPARRARRRRDAVGDPHGHFAVIQRNAADGRA